MDEVAWRQSHRCRPIVWKLDKVSTLKWNRLERDNTPRPLFPIVPKWAVWQCSQWGLLNAVYNPAACAPCCSQPALGNVQYPHVDRLFFCFCRATLKKIQKQTFTWQLFVLTRDVKRPSKGCVREKRLVTPPPCITEVKAICTQFQQLVRLSKLPL